MIFAQHNDDDDDHDNDFAAIERVLHLGGWNMKVLCGACGVPLKSANATREWRNRRASAYQYRSRRIAPFFFEMQCKITEPV